MRRISFLLVCLLITGLTSAQTLKKYNLAGSGCSYYNFCEISFELTKSEDSSAIWTGECLKDEINYGIICVKLKEPVTDLTMAEDLMINYADYLKTSFKITKVAGYGKGHRLQNKETTRVSSITGAIWIRTTGRSKPGPTENLSASYLSIV